MAEQHERKRGPDGISGLLLGIALIAALAYIYTWLP